MHVLCSTVIKTRKTFFRGCYFQEGSAVKMDMDVDLAYQKSLQTVVNWINREVNPFKSLVFFRTYAPVHFRFILKLTCNDANFLLASVLHLVSKLTSFIIHTC